LPPSKPERHEGKHPLRLGIGGQQALTDNRPVDIYAGLGDKEQAFVWLEKASQECFNDLAHLNVLPEVDALRSAALRRVGLAR
jgi:hypothetical protein